MRFQVSKGHLALLTKLGKSPLKESPVKLEVKEKKLDRPMKSRCLPVT